MDPRDESDARSRQLARLYAVSSAVGEALVRIQDPKALFDIACRIAVEQGLAALAWVGAYRADEDRVVPLTRFGADDGYVDGIVLRIRADGTQRGPAARALSSGAPAITNDIASDPDFQWKEQASIRGFRSCAVFPLRLDERAPGIFAIYATEPDFFRADEIRVLTALTENISFAVASAESDRALRESEERFRVLSQLGDAMRQAPSADAMLPAALRLLGTHLKVTRCAYAEIGPDGDRASIPYDYTDGCASIAGEHQLSAFGERLHAEFRRAVAPVVIRDTATECTEHEREMLATLDIRAFVCCCLVRKGSLRAMMAVHQATARAFTQGEIDLVQEVVERLWATIEQRAAETKLRQSETLLRIAGRAAHFGAWRFELDPPRVTWSDEVCAIHEMPPGHQPTLDDAIRFYTPECQPVIRELVGACARDGTPFDVEVQIDTAKGRRVWVRAIGNAERVGDGPITALHGAFQEIDAQKRLEEELRQSQKMDAIGRLAGGVAHDFNNLLSVILSYASFASKRLPHGDPLRADIEEIRRAGERAAELTRQLLAFSRQQVLEPRVLDVQQVFAGMENMLRRMLGEDVALSVETTPRLGTVLADPSQIEQIVMNLCVNARDAMPRGGTVGVGFADVELDAKALASDPEVQPGPFVRISISDQGVGMDDATRLRIFEPFYTTKELGKGTGLGLSTVFGIVKQNGGHIGVWSEPGKGSRFDVHLPRSTAPYARTSIPPAASDALEGNETVLLVEDEEQVRAMGRAVLRRHGYTVLDAQNGGEAFLICEQYPGPIHLLVTDVVMPRMSGRELAERLAPMRPTMQVLYVSGYAESTIVHHGVLEPGIAFLAKPVTPELLLRKVRAVLDAN